MFRMSYSTPRLPGSSLVQMAQTSQSGQGTKGAHTPCGRGAQGGGLASHVCIWEDEVGSAV